ncbi:LuxR family transcriptional regulator [Eggerthellaceae bacterium zg-886]|uniref:LuxR family transcriptional regulator n=2 Tax=Xiamenia xianingshaonis TaxID=2682776 RepID=A0ABX0IKF6_9ACTN|nr:LuxR family transcriptional regulator [Xiamenia xianingshaonis]
MSVMFLCAVSCSASFGAYLLTRNRMYLFSAVGFFLYYFDLSFIFQTENLGVQGAFGVDLLYSIQAPYAKALIATGLLGSFWLVICEYIDEKDKAVRAIPCVVFLVCDLLIVVFMEGGPVRQWLFYSMRELFLVWCFAFLLYTYYSDRSSCMRKALVGRQKGLILLVGVIACFIVAENTYVILLWQPAQEVMDSGLPLYISERNFSENALVVVFGVLAIRHAVEALRLRHIEPPVPSSENQERYVVLSVALFSDKWGLTARERDVLKGIVDGKDNQNIASELNLALGTVKAHTHNIFKKANVATRQDLLRKFWGK